MLIDEWPKGETPYLIRRPYFRKQFAIWAFNVYDKDKKRHQFNLYRDFETSNGRWILFVHQFGAQFPRPPADLMWQNGKWEIIRQRCKPYPEIVRKLRKKKISLSYLASLKAKYLRQVKSLRNKLQSLAQQAIIEKPGRAASKKKKLPLLPHEQAAAYQYIGPMWWHEAEQVWCAWLGRKHRRLLALGDDDQEAEMFYWVLKHALQGGTWILREWSSSEFTIRELLNSSFDQTRAILRTLGWTLSRDEPRTPQAEDQTT